MRLSEEEVANITQHKSIKKTKVKSEMMIMKDAAAPQSAPHAVHQMKLFGKQQQLCNSELRGG